MKIDSCILLTGATGALGGHLLERLSERYDVYVLGRSAPTGNVQNFIKFDSLPLDLPYVVSRLKNLKIKTIIHLAAQTTVWRSWRNPTEDLVTNAVFTLQMAELATAIEVDQFVFFSSESVFGDIPHPTESAVPEPSSPYGLSKHTAERYLETFYSRHMDIRIIRPSFIVSSEMTRNPIYDLLMASQQRLQRFESPFTGDSLFNFVCPEEIAVDVFRIISGLSEDPVLHSVGTEAQLQDAYKEVMRIANLDIDIVWGEQYRVAAIRSNTSPPAGAFTAAFENNIRRWLSSKEAYRKFD